MKISKQSKREAKELFRSCLVQQRLDEERVRRVMTQVAATRPRGYFAILTHFQRLVKLELERRTARVGSAVPLAPDLQADVQRRLSAIYGPGLEYGFLQEPALLGGLRIKVGSDVYDGSIQARLKALAECF